MRGLLESLFKCPETQDVSEVSELRFTEKPNEAIAMPGGALLNLPNKITILHTPPMNLSPEEAMLKVATAVTDMTPDAASLTALDEATVSKRVYCVRTPVMRYPDLIYAFASPARENDMTDLYLYSHSTYGYSDLGANQKRLTEILNRL